MAKIPKYLAESEPIAEVTKIVQPIGQKNVAGTQINPATNEILSSILERFHLQVESKTIASGIVYGISSGQEWIVLSPLMVEGKLVCSGILEVI